MRPGCENRMNADSLGCNSQKWLSCACVHVGEAKGVFRISSHPDSKDVMNVLCKRIYLQCIIKSSFQCTTLLALNCTRSTFVPFPLYADDLCLVTMAPPGDGPTCRCALCLHTMFGLVLLQVVSDRLRQLQQQVTVSSQQGNFLVICSRDTESRIFPVVDMQLAAVHGLGGTGNCRVRVKQ
jgi:hypothetical protein